MIEIVIFSALLLLTLVLGRRALRIFSIKDKLTFLERLVICFGLGMGILSLSVLYIGLVGFLYRWLMLVLLAGLTLVLASDIKEVLSDIVLWLSNLGRISLSPFEILLLAFILSTWFFTLIGSMAPILGSDALSYHMRDPKLFIEAHKVKLIPYTRDSLWPFFTQMLFTLGLLLNGPILSKLFHFAFGIFSIAGLYVLCRRYWPRLNSLVSCTVFALIPAVITVTTYAYTEMEVVFYTVLAFYLLLMSFDTEGNKWFYLAAIFCGFLIGIKLTSASVPFMAIFLYALFKKQGINKKLLPVLVFISLVIAIGGVWYIRSWLILGNPIFPFAANLFGGNGYPEEHLRYHTIAGLGIGIIPYLKMLWPLTLYPDKFGGESIGPLFLIFLPMLMFARRPPRFIKYTAVIAILLYTSWFLSFQYTRFLLPALAFMSVLAAYSYMEVCKRDRLISIVSTAALVLCLTYSLALSVYHNIDKFSVAFSVEKESEFLTRRERTYAMADYVNKNLPKDTKILVLGEPGLFHFDRYAALATSVRMDISYSRVLRYKGNFDDYLHLIGFEYILCVKDNTPGRDEGRHIALDEVFVGDKKDLIKRTEFAYRDERYTYELWKLE